MKKIIIYLLFIAICFKGRTIDAFPDKTLNVVVFSSDVPAIDPWVPSFDPDSYSVILQIFDSLVYFDLNGKMKPALATQWKLVAPTVYEFDLRKDVFFHNGESFNAEAVKFTYDAVFDPQINAGNAWILNTIKFVEIIDPYKIRIHLKHEDGMFLYRLNMFGSIAPPKYIRENGWDAFHRHPIGTGPYRFVSWEKTKAITLKRNKNYWRKGVPKTDRLVFKIINEENWAESLVAGKVDMVPNLSGNYAAIVNGLNNCAFKKRLVCQAYWIFLSNKGPLANVSVRRALNYAVDKNVLIRFVDSGFGKALGGISKQGEFGYNPDVLPYPYDLEKAKQLMKEAGFENGFSLDCLAADTTRVLAKYIKSALKGINVQLNVEVVPRPEWAKRVVMGKMIGKPYKGDMAINLVDNPIYNTMFHMGLFLDSKSPWSLLNDPEIDQKLQKALCIADADKHEKALKKLDRFIHEQAYLLFAYQKVKTVGYRNSIVIPGIPLNGHSDYEIFSLAEVK